MDTLVCLLVPLELKIGGHQRGCNGMVDEIDELSVKGGWMMPAVRDLPMYFSTTLVSSMDKKYFQPLCRVVPAIRLMSMMWTLVVDPDLVENLLAAVSKQILINPLCTTCPVPNDKNKRRQQHLLQTTDHI